MLVARVLFFCVCVCVCSCREEGEGDAVVCVFNMVSSEMRKEEV